MMCSGATIDKSDVNNSRTLSTPIQVFLASLTGEYCMQWIGYLCGYFNPNNDTAHSFISWRWSSFILEVLLASTMLFILSSRHVVTNSATQIMLLCITRHLVMKPFLLDRWGKLLNWFIPQYVLLKYSSHYVVLVTATDISWFQDPPPPTKPAISSE